MVAEEPTEGRCNGPAGEDNQFYCESYPETDENGEPINGRCRYHGSRSGAPEGNQNAVGNDGGAPPGNTNAMEHGMYSGRSAGELYPELPEDAQDDVDDLVASYVDRWGWDEDDPRISSRLIDVCVDVWRRWRAKGILIDEGPSEERVVGVNDRGDPVVATEEHHLQQQVSRVDSDIRMNLKELEPSKDDDVVATTAADLLSAAWQRLEDDRDQERDDVDREEPIDVEGGPV